MTVCRNANLKLKAKQKLKTAALCWSGQAAPAKRLGCGEIISLSYLPPTQFRPINFYDSEIRSPGTQTKNYLLQKIFWRKVIRSS